MAQESHCQISTEFFCLCSFLFVAVCPFCSAVLEEQVLVLRVVLQQEFQLRKATELVKPRDDGIILLRGFFYERIDSLLHLFGGNSLESHVLLKLSAVRGDHRHSLVVNVDVKVLTLVNVALNVPLVDLLNFVALSLS